MWIAAAFWGLQSAANGLGVRNSMRKYFSLRNLGTHSVTSPALPVLLQARLGALFAQMICSAARGLTGLQHAKGLKVSLEGGGGQGGPYPDWIGSSKGVNQRCFGKREGKGGGGTAQIPASLAAQHSQLRQPQRRLPVAPAGSPQPNHGDLSMGLEGVWAALGPPPPAAALAAILLGRCGHKGRGDTAFPGQHSPLPFPPLPIPSLCVLALMWPHVPIILNLLKCGGPSVGRR